MFGNWPEYFYPKFQDFVVYVILFAIKCHDFSSVLPTTANFDSPSVTTIKFYVVLKEREREKHYFIRQRTSLH